ncbi:multidrug ABC transporter ATP-binding protein (plasmid) [Leptolyngbya sp. BL0902]|uniref:hypothetical protein n=1 Tax=Leptolyngbya sp. BL0902 TaxID=1115757 RepID=UPI0018E87F34|nr:hypothetical protein [Leptolyngbya sp. BL0902]QQE67501.1 multidrug ABC transporter ATP-binding protein [Leptolyngbya sp. BL0902]
MGDIIAHIYSEADPGAGFDAIKPDLEDVYFCVMQEIPALPSANGADPTAAIAAPES